MLTNKNHAIATRRVKVGHYQIIITNVQSGKCLKVLADAVQIDQNDTEFECYVEGLYQGFVNPKAFNKLFVTEEDDADEFARKVGLTESEMFHAEEVAYRACADCPTSDNRKMDETLLTLADSYFTATHKDQNHQTAFNYTNKGLAAAAGRKLNQLHAEATKQGVRLDASFFNEVRRLTGRK